MSRSVSIEILKAPNPCPFYFADYRLWKSLVFHLNPVIFALPSQPKFGRYGQQMDEIVYTVTDFYDGPRGGIANYHGIPHVYSCPWDEAADDWSDTFLLQPIDDETFRLAMEDWAIWRRWEKAFDSGQTTLSTHPAMPGGQARHEELSAILKSRMQIDPEHAVRTRGRFEVRTPGQRGLLSSFEWVVNWES